jgi:hypothetical protein
MLRGFFSVSHLTAIELPWSYRPMPLQEIFLDWYRKAPRRGWRGKLLPITSGLVFVGLIVAAKVIEREVDRAWPKPEQPGSAGSSSPTPAPPQPMVHEPADSPQHAPNELVAPPSPPDEMRETLEVRVFGPQVLTGGSELSLSIEVSTTAFLVVYSVDELGRGGLLWPKPTDPELVARPAQPVSLPRGRQDMLTVVAETRSLEDSVIACGFVDRAAKDAFRRRLSMQGSRVPASPAALLDGLSGSYGCGRLDYMIVPGKPR